MARTADHPSAVPSIELSEALPARLDGELGERVDSPIELALQLTEAALGQLTKVVMDNIRHGGDASPHVEAAERDLRNALRQLSVVKRNPRP
ncbi:MAG TPA: hypothetical protein VMF09_12370 [Solirubrobacteraceae bacterium]|nr:hypothetical protein [Solirubrobacteraceae bacterium]